MLGRFNPSVKISVLIVVFVSIASTSAQNSCPEELQFVCTSCKGATENKCNEEYLVRDTATCQKLMQRRGCGLAFAYVYASSGPTFPCRIYASLEDVGATAASSVVVDQQVDTVLLFKMTSGVSNDQQPSVAQLVMKGTASKQHMRPRSTLSDTKTKTKGYFKSPLWGKRNDLPIGQISVNMFANDTQPFNIPTCGYSFANAQDDNGAWFNLQNLVASTPWDVNAVKTASYTQATISDTEWGPNSIIRDFYFMVHGGCDGDNGPMVVVSGKDTCSWGNFITTMPEFLCNNNWKPGVSTMVKDGKVQKDFEIYGRLGQRVDIISAQI
jgi:hypothetical protein